MTTLSEFVCFNQKKIIQFEYLMSHYFERFLKKYKSDVKNSEEIESSYYELLAEGLIESEEVFKRNAEFIINTFGEGVRFTIKIVYDDMVVDFYRYGFENNMPFVNETKSTDNTAFDSIMGKGRAYYLNNNIELSYMKGEYKNPRLIPNRQEQLRNGSEQWYNIWENYNFTAKKTSYKSTLVIPMSIIGTQDDIGKVYYDYLFRHGKNSNNRTIWGFFCLDADEENYFRDEHIPISTIIADLLSIYIVFFYKYAIAPSEIREYEASLS